MLLNFTVELNVKCTKLKAFNAIILSMIGIITSTEGSVLLNAYSILRASNIKLDIVVVSDRTTSLGNECQNLGIPYFLIKWDRNFHQETKKVFEGYESLTAIQLFFTRIVGPEVFSNWITLNTHPSLLPAFPGIGALEASFLSRDSYIGTTSHLVNEKVDGGPIVMQCRTLKNTLTTENYKKISFYQKLYLFLAFVESEMDRENFSEKMELLFYEVTSDPFKLEATRILKNKKLLGSYLAFISQDLKNLERK